MLEINIPATEVYDETNNLFVTTKEYTLKLEHSLLSLSKWESKWKKPFLSKDNKTAEETSDYIRCMTINSNVDKEVYEKLRISDIEKISLYIDDPMTASWVREEKPKSRGRIITSELIYYWMIALNIPMECEKWHLNRLLMLIKVCNAENAPKKKMTAKEQRELNDARLRASKAKGNK